MTLRVAVLQLNPRIGQVPKNIEKANNILKRHGFASSVRRRLDLLILPELAFTGYDFKSRAEIEPYLEPTCSGISTKWAQQVSRDLNCHTLVGYPEISFNTIYNAAAMVAPSGEVLFNYRKTFLYSADEEWGCSESADGFQSYGPFQSLGGLKIQVGICMDLNPYKFQAPFDKFEFANSAAENDVSLILCPMAWLHSDSPSLQETDELKKIKKASLKLVPSEPNMSTVNYWLLRMTPFISSRPSKRIAMITCNRSGLVDDVLYAGSSSMFTFDPDAPKQAHYVRYYGSLGQFEEDLMYHEVLVDCA
jgi:protein N-terminal amidase